MAAAAFAYPPGPRLSAFGAVAALRRDPLGFFQRIADDYGDVAHLKLPPCHVYALNHPDHAHEVLVARADAFMKGQAMQEAKRIVGDSVLTVEGAQHRRQRRILQPLFRPERIAGYAAPIVEYAARTRARWRAGEELDLHHEMTQLTLAVVAKTLFDQDIEQQDAQAVGAAMNVVFEGFGRITLPFAKFLAALPLPANLRFRRAKAELDAAMAAMIAERKRHPGRHDDLLSRVLQARDEETGGALDERQARDEAITMFLAGHETTANALAWTWYLLALHPEAERALHAEVDALGGALPGSADLPRLPYARMVLAEAMRLYPPVWIIGRRALQDVALGGYTIPARAVVVLCPYVAHRDPRFWPEPGVFRPERWTPECAAARPKFAYFPFGGGPRVCIGESFAWMEGTLILAAIAQRWRLRLVPGHPVEPLPRITLRPKHGLRMVPEARP